MDEPTTLAGSPYDVATRVLDVTFEAVIVTGAAVDGVGERLVALAGAGLQVLVVGGPGGDLVALTADGLRPMAPHPGGDGDRSLDGPAGPGRRAARWLSARGVTGGLVLVVGRQFAPVGGAPGPDSPLLVPELRRAVVVSVGDETGPVPSPVLALGGGRARLTDLLDSQLQRRARRRVPQIDLDPDWVVRLPATGVPEQVAESLGALSNGWAGSRGSREEDGPEAAPLFVVKGVFSDGHLLGGPLWTRLDRVTTGARDADERHLDLRTGVLARSGPGFATLRLVSLAPPHAVALRAEGSDDELEPGAALRVPAEGGTLVPDAADGVCVGWTAGSGGSITLAAHQRVEDTDGRRTVERLAGWSTRAAPAGATEARERLAQIRALGFDELLAAHRRAWAGRWEDAGVVIEGAPGDQLAARFAVFHLLAAAPDVGEVAVGARGLTGRAYAGHVFWDADVFVLPALAALRPAAARAILEYRVRRLDAARRAAHAQGREGARFPWESAGAGTDVTPHVTDGPDGHPVAVVTGEREEHITADVAWAACRYSDWTGDGAFLGGAGRPLLVDTARYWASRIEPDEDGRGHLRGVIGPDEYHECVDDNAYTNVMARWNLRRGAELLEAAGNTRTAAGWRDVADRMVDGWNPARRIYEQFWGYFDLEPLLAADVATPPFAADMLLDRDRLAGSQLLKQADVLMAHHLVPDEMAPGSLDGCLDFYGPRTTQGSSLSPAVHASLLARAGRSNEALDLFRLAARLDLDDLTGTTAGGLHLATMGGVWQALAYGFLGLAATSGVLRVDPRLPAAWEALGLRLSVFGRRIGVRATHFEVRVDCEAPLMVDLAHRGAVLCRPPGRTFPLEHDEGSPS